MFPCRGDYIIPLGRGLRASRRLAVRAFALVVTPSSFEAWHGIVRSGVSPFSRSLRNVIALVRANTVVQCFAVVAVHAENLKPRRIPLVSEPFVNSCPSIANFFPVRGTVIIDMIESKKLWLFLPTAGTYKPAIS